MRLYIDPGTGSMLFTVLVALAGSLVYLLRNLWIKLGVLLSGGKKDRRAEKLPLVIFSDHKRYWNIFEPVCNELERRGQETIYMTESPDDPALSKSYEHIQTRFIGEGNRAYAKLNTLRASILLSTTPGLDVYQWKRSRDVDYYVHIGHASTDMTLYRMFGIDYYDAVLLSGEYQERQIRKLEALRNIPAKELKIVGLPYMDEARRRLEQAAPLDSAMPRTVLLAPSWGPSGILTRFGEKMIDALLATGYHLIIRPHPQSFVSEKELMDRLMSNYPEDDRLEWNRDNDNFEALRRSDILISDFSGVFYDYALNFDKPILYADTSFDNSIYDACWLDEQPWTLEKLPLIGKPVTEEMLPEMKKHIDACLEDGSFAKAREKARKEAWAYPGEGAVRAVDYLMDKLEELKAGTAEPERA